MDKAQALSEKLFAEEEGSLYAVLDGASVPGLLEKLDQDGPEHECLYRGELKQDIAEVAPYLVRLEAEDEFTAWVLEQGWGKHWGIFAHSRGSLRDLRQHFRRFLTVYDPNGKPLLFRYYDPRVLRAYLPTCNQEELAILFGPVTCYLAEAEDPKIMLRFQFASGKLVERKDPLSAKED